MPADVLAAAEQVAVGGEEPGRVQAAGRLEGGLRLPQPRGSPATSAAGTRRRLSTSGASTATASSAPLPHTPHDDEV